MLKGIDISEYQKQQDFNALKQGFDFVIARSSFGTARADNQFQSNRDGLLGTGQLRGFYHYAYPSNNTPEAEAEFCFKTIGQLQNGELVALDFEESYSDPVTWSLKFLQHFEQLSGYKPLLYINLALIQAHDWTPVIKNDNGLWLAEWDFNPDGTVPSVPWSVVAMRQYTDKLTFNGQAIDADVFYGDANTFTLYGYKGTPTASQPDCLVPNTPEWQAKYAELVSKATSYDSFVTAGYNSPDDIKKTITDLTTARENNLTSYNNEVEANQKLSSQLNDLDGQVRTLTDANTGLKTNISEVQKRNVTLLGQMQDMEKADSTAVDSGLIAESQLKELTSDMQSIAGALQTKPDVKSILTAIDALKSAHEQTVKQAQNFFQLLLNIFWRKKK